LCPAKCGVETQSITGGIVNAINFCRSNSDPSKELRLHCLQSQPEHEGNLENTQNPCLTKEFKNK